MATIDDLTVLLEVGLKTNDPEIKRQIQQAAMVAGRETSGWAKAGAGMGTAMTSGIVKALKDTDKDIQKVSEHTVRTVGNLATEGARRGTNALRIEQQKQADLAKKGEQQVTNAKRQGGIDQAAIFRANARSQLQVQQQNDRMIFTAEQNAQARRTAMVKTGLAMLRTTYEFGLKGIGFIFQKAWGGISQIFHREHSKIETETKDSMRRQDAAIKLGLDQQNATYTRGAQKRLDLISANTKKETKVITEEMVKQRDAVSKIQEQTSTGVLGFLSGRGGRGGLRRVLGGLGILGGAAGVGGIVRGGWQRLNDIEDATAGLTVILGDQKKAVDLTAKIMKVVTGTPFAFPDFATYGKNLAAFGIEADKIPGILTAIGDAASATGGGADSIESIASAFGDMASSGIIHQDQLNRLNEAGVNTAEILSRAYGVETDQLRTMIRKGMIPATEAIGFLVEGIEKGAGSSPKLAGMMKKAGDATSGATENMKTALNRLSATVLKPIHDMVPRLSKTFIGFADGIGEFVQKLYTGKGAWKVLRDGLIGIAVGLTAIGTAKLGFEILKTLPSVIGILTAHPVIGGIALLAGAIGALVLHSDAIKNFFVSLWEGTRGWFLVGYRIKGVYDQLSPMVTIQSAIGAGVRKFVDFFKAFVNGTRGWFLVGYRIRGVIDNLSWIVTLQSSVGAAVGAVVDSIGTLVSAWPSGDDFSFESVWQAFQTAGTDFKERLKPIKDAVAGALADIQAQVSAFFIGLFTGSGDASKDTEATAAVGKRLHDIIVNAIKVAGSTIGDFFAGLFSHLKAGGSGDQSAARTLAERLHKIVTNAISIMGRALGSFFSGLFKADPAGEHVAAMALGIQLRRIVQAAFKTVKEGGGDFFAGLFVGTRGVASGARRVGTQIHDALADVFSNLGELFTDNILPAIIDFPRKVGKFLSKTIFSEPLMKAAIAAAAGIGGAAALIAVQFVRGFIEGLWEQRGAITDTIRDILVLVAKTIVGTGNPFLIIGGALAAAFAAIKIGGPIFKAVEALKVNASAAFLTIGGHTEDAARLVMDYRSKILKTKLAGEGLGSGMVGAADTLRSSFGTIGTIVSGLWNTLTSIGRWPNEFAERFEPQIDRIKEALSTLFQDPEFTMPDFGGDDGMGIMDKIKGNFALGFDLITTKAKGFAESIKTYLRKAADEFSFVAGVANFTMGAISGYFIATADNAAVKSASIVASIGNIAGAFAENPYLGLAAAAGTAIGYIAGHLQKGKEDAKKYADYVKKQGEGIEKSLTDSLVAAGEAGQRGRGPQKAAVLTAINDQLKQSKSLAQNVKSQFGVTYSSISQNMAGSRTEASKFAREVINNRITQVLHGNRDAAKHFRGQMRMAADDTHKLGVAIEGTTLGDLVTELGKGNISLDTFRKRAEKAEIRTGAVEQAIKRFKESLKEHIENSPAALFLKNLPGKMTAARKAALNQIETQGLLNAAQEAAKSPIERLNDRIGAQSSAWDTARSAVKNYILAKKGLAPSMVDTERSLRGTITQMSELKNTYDGNLEKSALLTEAQGLASDAMANLASSGITDVDKLKKAYGDWIDKQLLAHLPKSVRENKTLMGELRDQLINLPDGTAEVAIANAANEKGKVGDVKAALDAVVKGSPYVATLTVEQQEALTGSAEAKMSAEEFASGFYSANLDSDPTVAKAKIALTTKEAIAYANNTYKGKLSADDKEFFDVMTVVKAAGFSWEQAQFMASIHGDPKLFNQVMKDSKAKGKEWAIKTWRTKLDANADKLDDSLKAATITMLTWEQRTFYAKIDIKASPGLADRIAQSAATTQSDYDRKYGKKGKGYPGKGKGGYAAGGFITKPEIALVGEAGPELILPLSDPARIKELLTQAGMGAPAGTGPSIAGARGAGPMAGATAAITTTAQANTDEINKATTDTAAAFAPIGQKMTDAAQPGFTTLEQQSQNTGAAIKTTYTDTQKATVKSSAVWPEQMRAAAAPGIARNHAAIATSNQAVKTNYTQTRLAVTNTAGQMANGVAVQAESMRQRASTSAANTSTTVQGHFRTMSANVKSTATQTANSVHSTLTTKLSNTSRALGTIVSGYATSLVKAINPVLTATGAKPIKLATGGEVPRRKLARGGYIGGPPVERDIVPAMLMPGEYVVRKAAVQRYGIERMEKLNKGQLPGFAAGGLVYPIAGYSTQGQANSWGNPRSGGRSHKGSDLFAPLGSQVVSVMDGVVSKTGNGGLGGITVSVEKAGWVYYYAHLLDIAAGIAKGAIVKQGQVLGRVDNTGNARGTPSHLHFSIYPVAGGYNAGINPWPLLTGSQSVPGAPGGVFGPAGMAIDLPAVPDVKRTGMMADAARSSMKHMSDKAGAWASQMMATSGIGAAGMSEPYVRIDPAIFKNINPNAVLATIRLRESGGNYRAQNPTSSASGAYGFLTSSFENFGGHGPAKNSSPAEQDRVAMNFLNWIIGKYGANLEAIPATWYEGHYNGPGSLNHTAADGGSVRKYVDKWIQQYQAVLAGNMTRLAEGGLVPDLGVAAVRSLGSVNGSGSTTNNNRSFQGPIIGNVNVHSNASDAEAIAMLLGARLDPIARRAMVSA